MSTKYPGGIISKTAPTPSGPYSTDTAPGIWTLEQQAYWQKLGQWPTAGNFPKDAQFNYVTMLLHGDGTNGAQNNTFLDSSTNNFTITRNGNTTQGSFSPYGSNWSNYFDGSGDYLTVPDNSALEGFTNFTFECWLYVSDFSSGDIVFSKGFGPGFCPYMFYFTSTDLTFYASSSLTSWDVASGEVIVPNIVKNQWYHVAVSRSGSSIKLFSNGAVTTSLTNGSTLGTNTTAFTIGAALDGTRDPAMYVSNLRINNTALYTAAFTPSTTPLTAVSGTALLTCQSNRFIDNSTNAFTVSSFGNTSVQRFNPFGTSTAYSTSVIGGSGYFDGSGDYLSIASNTAFVATTGYTMTFEAWVYCSTASSVGDHAIFSRVNPASPYNGYDLRVDYDGTNFTVCIDAGFATTTSSINCQKNAWNHVVWQFDNAGVRSIWVNGARGLNVTGSGTSVDYTTSLSIGSRGAGAYTNGYICDARLIKQTTAYYSGATITIPTAPLTAVTNTQLLTSFQNGAIFDNAMMNDLETVGNAQISTSVYKYGTGSMYFDGSGSKLKSPSLPNYNFGTGDFTIEMWAYANSIPSYPSAAFLMDSRTNASWYIFFASNALYFGNSTGTEYSGGTLTTSVWYHIAICRSSGTTKGFVNGVQAFTFSDSGSYVGSPILTVGGRYTLTTYDLNGYIDDLRITTGYARYTANFTPPTAAFPDIGPT